jgi:hypothetical protein
VILYHSPGLLILESDLYSLKGGAKSFCSHEVSSLGEDDVQVALKYRADMCLLKIPAEVTHLDCLGVLLTFALRSSISIFNQKRQKSNN